jgi:hypothetical protein
MAYTPSNLTMLQRVCDQINIEIPSVLTSLTMEQQQILRLLDDQHKEICGKKDWWFLQRVGDLSLWPATTTGTATVAASTVTISTGDPFSATLTVNGKMQLGSVGDTYKNDRVRVDYATTTKTATIKSTWPADRVVSADTFFYGQDEYALASDCDRVSWVLIWRSAATTILHQVLEAISIDELENIRHKRSTYFTAGQPLYYCVLKHRKDADVAAGTDTTAPIRRIVFDPFPELVANVTYGYFLNPPTLYSTSTVYPALPPKYEQLLCDKAALQYYATGGMGSPVGSVAGQDVKARIEETLRDVQEAETQMMDDQKIAQEVASMDSSGATRMFYEQTFGRSI